MRLIMCLILVALAAAFVWLLGYDSTASVITTPTPDAVEEHVEDEAKTPAHVTEPIATEATAAQPDEASTRKAIIASATGLVGELTAVRFVDDQPIEGAELGFVLGTINYQELSEEDMRAVRRGDIEFYRKHGTVLKTNAKGKCQLPLNKHGQRVIVTFEDLYVSSFVGPKDLAVTARLKQDHTLVIQVRDAAGGAAEGVKVIGHHELPHGPQSYQFGKSNAAGQFSLHHTQDYAENGQGQSMSVHAKGVGAESETVEVDLLSARNVHVSLSMPRAGTITFELLDEAGKPFDQSGYEPPTIGVATHDTKPGRRDAYKSMNENRLAFGTDSRAVIRYVALDKFYTAFLHNLIKYPLIGKGPTTSTPDITVPIVVPSDAIIFKGRVVNTDGEPLAGESLYLVYRHRNGMGGQTSTTGDDGEFLIPMIHLEAGKEVQLSGLIRSAGKPTLSFRHQEPWMVTKGRNDIGEIAFAQSPVLLTGQLIVPPALESTQQIWWQIELHNGKRWTEQSEFETLWHKDRRFEVRGEATEGSRLKLVFQQGAYLPLEPLEFSAGTKDIEITLAAAGSVTATFLLDDLVHKPALRVRLEPEAPVDEKDPRQRMRWMTGSSHHLHSIGKGRLQAAWKGLESGRYTLTMECYGASQPLVSIAGIQVCDGGVLDPRLKDIDLRGRLRKLEIRLIDEQGQAFTQEKTVVYLVSGDDTEWNGYRPKNGKVKVSVVDSARIRVLAKGHTLLVEDGVSTDREIVVKRAPAIRFAVKWPSPLPEGITAELRLTPTVPGTTRETRGRIGGSSGGITSHGVSKATIDHKGLVTVYPMVLGKQRVMITLNPNGKSHSLYQKAWRSIEITGHETQPIELEVLAEALQRTLDRMK